MSTPDIIGNMTRGWHRDPQGVSMGTPLTGVSAALWSHDGDGTEEVRGDPDPTRHIICVMASRFDVDLEIDGVGRCARRSVSTGGVQIVRAGERPRAVIYGGPWRVLHVYLPVQLLGQGMAAAGFSRPVELVDPLFRVDRTIERIGGQYLHDMRNGNTLSRLRSDIQALELVMRLVQVHAGSDRRQVLERELGSLAKGGLAPWQVRRVSEYLEDHLADDVTLADLGELLGLSTFHLCRAFKQSTGLPPHRWRHQRRMERGRELLEGTNLSITEIAASVGYDDLSRFAAGFRKAFGCTPTDYRRERRS